MNAEETERRIRELVRKYRVSWQVWPESLVSENHKIVKVGYQLNLLGYHALGSHPTPGCELCKEVYSALHEIAAWILPHEKRESTYDMLTFDLSLHFDSSKRDPGHVELSIVIRHRENLEAPQDECELHCLNEMQERLSDMGASRGIPRAISAYAAFGQPEPR